jgi:hypothetical protein
MSRTRKPKSINVETLDLRQLQKTAAALANLIREYNRIFGRRRYDQQDRLFRQIQSTLEFLNVLIRRGELREIEKALATGSSALAGDANRCDALSDLLRYVRFLSLRGLPLSGPIPDAAVFDTAVTGLANQAPNVEQEIVEVLRVYRTLRGQEIADKIHHGYDYVRRILASMRRRGIIQRNSDGYFLP